MLGAPAAHFDLNLFSLSQTKMSDLLYVFERQPEKRPENMAEMSVGC